MPQPAGWCYLPPVLALSLPSVLLGSALAFDAAEALGEQDLRRDGQAHTLGGSDRSSLWYAQALGQPSSPWLGVAYAPEWILAERPRAPLDVLVVMRGGGLASVGDGQTWGLEGDGEEGLVSARGLAEVQAHTGWFEASVRAVARGDVGASPPVDVVVPRYSVGLRRGQSRLVFAQEPRKLGPARHGGLMLWDDAWNFPAGAGTLQHRFERIGVLRVETGVGWLQRPRADVEDPGLLWMDLRWAPLPWLEIGASRVSLFGGQGRPLPSVGQLFLPLDPHVVDDPDRELPDQDEIAAVDLRVLVPLPQPLDYLELYTQYGGDDMIMRSIGPIPTPSLAGIANLAGAELSSGAWLLGVEWARLQDDTFRWYTAHRVYHEGFTQEGRFLGHPAGGDTETWWARVRWLPEPYGVQLQAETSERVGVVEVVGDTVIALESREITRRIGISGVLLRPEGGSLAAGYELGHVEARDFVPGADGFEHRLYVTISGAPWVIYGNDPE